MSGLRSFLYEENEQYKEIRYPATKKFVDENGKVLEWVLRPLSKDELEDIYEESLKKVIVEGEAGYLGHIYDPNTYMSKLTTKSIVFPNLKDLELQESYNVHNEEELLKKLIDSPLEYRKFCEFVEELNEKTMNFDNDIEEIKALIHSDAEASYAHYCLHKLNMLPSEFLNLPRRERKFIMASIKLKIEIENEEQEKMKK